MKNIIYILSIILVTCYSCVDQYTADSTYIKDTNALPAASYLERTNALNVSIWVDLLKHTDLFNTLNLASDYTCFVPSNEAMQEFMRKKGISKITDLSIVEAKNLVKYHTIKGSLYSSISFEEGVLPDTTASGDYLSTSFQENGGAIRINLEASITNTIKTNNAYVHILDATLSPVTETIWGKMQAGNFSIFNQAIESAGYTNKLNTLSEIISDVKYKYYYTLFAVPDSTYQAAGINNFPALVTYLGAGNDYTAPSNALNQYVAYHLFNQQVSYSALGYFTQTDNKKSKNYNTLATDQLINISEVNKVLYANYDKNTSKGAKFIAVNKNCKNGVIHVVNDPLPIKTPTPTTFQWELTDYSVLASTLSKYRTAGLTSPFVTELSPETASCYKWQSVPSSKPGLIYTIVSKNDATPYKALNYDYLRLSLGTFGWVEMTSPTIVAGTYKITIEHYNLLAPQTQGKIWFIIDGVYFGNQIATQGASKTSNQFLKTPLSTGTITFSTTKKHTLRILASDNFSSDLDCLTFTPI